MLTFDWGIVVMFLIQISINLNASLSVRALLGGA